jgi:arylsulfatase A-like enzyme/tetratricopeptide (TPR) repeat protein
MQPVRRTSGRPFRGLLLSALVLVLGCGGGSRGANVLLVTFDTTRADRIGAYGNQRAVTPAIDSLAAEGVLFSNAHASIPLTLPSHATILTGLYPTAHGIRDNGLFVLADDVVTLPEILRERGYATAAAISGFPLVKRFNLGQGFDLYDDDLRRKDEDFLGRRPRRQSLFFEERRAARTNEAVLPWLEEHHDQPFFVWIHYYDPHRPWDPPPPYDELLADDPYQAEIAYADESLGQILDRLRAWGVFDDTMVVVTSDHGEGLGEHNESTHSLLNYETTLRVPMIVRPPGGTKPTVVDDLVAGVDIAPTVLDALGIEPPVELQGHSLYGYVTGSGGVPANRRFYAETLSPRLSHGWGELRTLYEGNWKYVHGPRPELYDLAADPDEHFDRAVLDGDRATELRQALGRFINDHAMTTAAAVPVDEQTRAQLMALGYISGGAESGPIVEELLDDGIPPQDRVVDINLSSEARNLLTAGRGAAARQVVGELLERDPINPFYRELMVRAELLSGRLETAADILGSILADPRGRGASAGVLATVGYQLVLAGDVERGLDFGAKAVQLDPSAIHHYQLASARREAGDPEGAHESLMATLDADPNHARAKVDLAIRLAVTGQRDLARETFEEALRNDPFYAKGHYNYGAFLLETGHPGAALERFRRATELDRGYRASYLAQVFVELQLGEVERAAETLSALETLAPESEETRRARELFRDAESS